MRYRWGFEEGGVFTECLPILEDETALDFAPQTNEMFYRAKLNGIISFRFEFNAILAKGYNYTHILVLQCYNDSDDSWKECWRGRFCLTDCEIDYDTNTINVQPETLDRYTAILDALENEYNLVKLAPDKQYVDILIRPCLQIYSLNNNKITNYVGNSWWESTCEPVSFSDISQLWKFHVVGTYYSVQVKWKSGAYAGQTINYTGTTRDGNQILVGKIYDGDVVIDTDTISVSRSDQQGDDISLLQIFRNGAYQCSVTFEYHGAGLEPISTWVSPTGDAEEVNAQWYDIYNRILVNTDLDYIDIGNQRVVFNDLGVDDMAGVNLNYNKCASLNYSTIQVDMYDATQEEPTQWGMSYYEDRYFKKLPDVPPIHYAPVGIDLWKYASLWWYAYTSSPEDVTYKQICELMAKKQRIADCYTLSSTIVKLMQAAGWTGTNLVSKFLDGTNDYVGDSFIPVIAPRSNVISSYYATPAQNAPISLAMCFNMLKNVYKVYWYIDDDNDLHVEHISFFRNGLAYYDDQTGLLVNLEERLHTDTKSNKVFCQNKIKFDKQDMPEVFTFGWADVQTKPFDGWPIKCLDAYVQKGQTDEHSEGKFDTDVDYVLTSPQNVTKDGFFLFAVPASGGVTDWSLNVQPVRIIDEEGESYDIEIQNADAAFVKIHESFWRYDMPCEQLNVNNANTVALSTGNFKSQTIEYADIIMADLLKDIANCIKVIRTQQGDGHIKSMSVNLNSLHTKTDLLFNFVGRWYYLRGTALGVSIDIIVNNTLINLDVTNNSFLYRYQEPITQLDFHQADVVSVDFSDCDKLDGLTSCDYMFDGCEELIGVNFGKKTFGAVISAQYMFRGCSALTTLICPSTSSWQPDIDFSDCPALTEDSLYQFIRYLYVYDSGVHTITTNSTMWNALAGAVQDDIIAKAAERGWTIAIPAQYSLRGTSSASVVYATINGNAMEIDVVGGNWSYDYNTPITSISFEADANVQTIDFSLSDGLANVTSLDNAFKDCTMLTSVNFTNCDISNVVSASDCFANCANLANLTIPSDSWKADVDFSTCPLIVYAEMQDIIGGLYTYSVGTHTITWNTTYWDSLTQAQQQTISDAADAKRWQTNAVMVIYYIRGTSTNVNGTETFNVQFIDDGALTPSTAETITCAVDGDGNFEYQYNGKKIYSMNNTFVGNNTITEIEFTEDFETATSLVGTFAQMKGNVSLPNAIISNAECSYMFYENKSNTISAPNATFNGNVSVYRMFDKCECEIISLPSATFANVTNTEQMFYQSKIKEINLPLATFTNTTTCLQMFSASTLLTIISLPIATFTNAATCGNMFEGLSSLTALTLPNATFASATNIVGIFANMSNCLTINIPNATFASATNIDYFAYQSAKITTIDATSATFANVTTTTAAFQTMNSLSNILFSEQNVAISNSATAANIDLRYSQLSYQSMVNVANIVKDRTNLSALTITFKTSVWNALSSAEQATIQGVLQSKNWNLATA